MDALNLIERLATLAKTINNIEAIELTNELRLEIATIKGTLADTINENRRLKTEVEKTVLQNCEIRPADKTSELEFRDGLYWNGEDGPFCTGCFEGSRKRIRVTQMGAVFHAIGRFRCPVCRATFH